MALLDKIDIKGKETTTQSSNLGLPAGTYYVKIRPYYFSSENYTFKVIYNSSNSWEKEPNDIYQNATPISINTTWYGALTSDSRADWYTFNLDSNGYIELDFSHPYLENGRIYWKLEVYNSDFKVVESIDSSGTETLIKDVKIGLKKGKYYIKVFPYYHSQLDYNFKVNFTSSNSWETELNDSISTANSLSVGSSKSGSIEKDSDSDWYSIKLPNGEYTLIFNSTLLNPERNYWKVELYNSDQSSKIDHDFSKNDSWNFSVTGNDSDSDQFYLRIRSNYHSRNNYTFSVVKKGNSAPVVPTEDDKNTDIPNDGQAMYRLYNSNSGEHHYTSDTNEKNTLVKLGWKYEGVGWIAPLTSKTPVYRMYNKNVGEHHYTIDAQEKDALTKLGWDYEGIGWYSDDNKSVPLYRQYNPKAQVGTHNYTTNKSENDSLVKMGWNAEGIAWYGMS